MILPHRPVPSVLDHLPRCLVRSSVIGTFRSSAPWQGQAMERTGTKRRLAAILMADVGHLNLMQRSKEVTSWRR